MCLGCTISRFWTPLVFSYMYGTCMDVYGIKEKREVIDSLMKEHKIGYMEAIKINFTKQHLKSPTGVDEGYHSQRTDDINEAWESLLKCIEISKTDK